MNYHGSCHCAQIRYEVEGDIGEVMDCNCSMCRRRGGLLWFVPVSQFKLQTLRSALGTYEFNKHAIRHHFCPICGIAPYSEGRDPAGQEMIAINVRCLDGVDLRALKIVTFDGASH